jgi:hypothetical protein
MLNNATTMRSVARSMGRPAVASRATPTTRASPYNARRVLVAAGNYTQTIDAKELASKIASLERQIKDANSEARKAPLVAQLNALKGGSSAPAPSRSGTPARPTSAPQAGYKAAPASAPIADMELAGQIASLERQIQDACSEARRAPLIAKLNALKGGSSSSPAPSRTGSPARPTSAPQAGYKAPGSRADEDLAAKIRALNDKELAYKIASLERQIKDANSEARKAPLVAQLNALWSKS